METSHQLFIQMLSGSLAKRKIATDSSGNGPVSNPGRHLAARKRLPVTNGKEYNTHNTNYNSLRLIFASPDLEEQRRPDELSHCMCGARSNSYDAFLLSVKWFPHFSNTAVSASILIGLLI